MKLTKRSAARLARGMGWFSIGLGASELLAARPIARWLGVTGHERKIRSFGLRELKAGFGILRADQPRPGLLVSRIVGDVMDLVALGAASRMGTAKRGPLAFATLAVVGATLADIVSAAGLRWGADDLASELGGESPEDLAHRAEAVAADAFPMPQAIGVG